MIPVDLPPPPPVVACATFSPDRRGGGRPRLDQSILSETLPLKVHWDPADADRARAEAVLAATEHAWRVQVGELGWRAPVLPDGEHGPELDVYIYDTGAWQAWAEVGEWADDTPGDAFLGASAHLVVDSGIPLDWIPSFMAHEFNHVCQWGMDFTEPSTNVWEATATAAQHWTLGLDGTWDESVDDYQDVPWMPAVYGDGYWLYEDRGAWSLYEYGAAVWPMVLDAQRGSDGLVGPELWTELAGRDRDVADGIEAVTGAPLLHFLAELATHRLPEARPDGPPRTREWAVVEHAVIDVVGEAAIAPMATGHAFVRVLSPPERARVRVDGAGEGVALVVVRGEEVLTALEPPIELEVERGELSSLWVAVAQDAGDRDRPYVALPLTVIVEEIAESRGCGCRGGRGGEAALLLPLALLGLRRRAR